MALPCPKPQCAKALWRLSRLSMRKLVSKVYRCDELWPGPSPVGGTGQRASVRLGTVYAGRFDGGRTDIMIAPACRPPIPKGDAMGPRDFLAQQCGARFGPWLHQPIVLLGPPFHRSRLNPTRAIADAMLGYRFEEHRRQFGQMVRPQCLEVLLEFTHGL